MKGEKKMTKLNLNEINGLWSRGIDFCVIKAGKKWRLHEAFGKAFPLYTTKKYAYEAATRLVLHYQNTVDN